MIKLFSCFFKVFIHLKQLPKIVILYYIMSTKKTKTYIVICTLKNNHICSSKILLYLTLSDNIAPDEASICTSPDKSV